MDFFWRFRTARHISRVNCAETNWDRHGQAAYEIFSIERRFERFMSLFFRFKESMRASKSGTSIEVAILPLLASLTWKWLQIGMGMLPITTSTSDELFSCINIDDFERPWTSEIRGFYWFLRSSAAAHTRTMNCNEMAGDQLTVCEQKLLQAFVHLVSISSNFLHKISCTSCCLWL